MQPTIHILSESKIDWCADIIEYLAVEGGADFAAVSMFEGIIENAEEDNEERSTIACLNALLVNADKLSPITERLALNFDFKRVRPFDSKQFNDDRVALRDVIRAYAVSEVK
jgi:hypothetical protein